MARSLGVERDRVRAVVGAAIAAGVSRGEPPLTKQEWEALVPALFAERMSVAPTEQRQQLARFHDAIVEGLASNTAQTVWQRPRDEHGLEVSIRTFRRYMVECVADGPNVDGLTVRNEVTPPGQVAEVDYGAARDLCVIRRRRAAPHPARTAARPPAPVRRNRGACQRVKGSATVGRGELLSGFLG
jgi:hypothetical protein